MHNPDDYLAKAAGGRGVLVLHAWWGLTPFIQGLCDRLAGAGFTALAPDLYHGATAATIPEAEKLRGKLKRAAAQAEIIRAAQTLQAECGGSRDIGLLGFSLGGYYALWLAQQPGNPVAAAVVFYGTSGGDYAHSRAAFQFHFAERDEYVSASGKKALEKSLRAAGREVEFHTYPGTGHWFFESDRLDAYQPQAAELAWARCIEFYQQRLQRGPE